jgi:hypothetical protein
MGLENYIPANLLLWIEPIITILLGLVLGLFFKKFLVSRLISLSEKNNWQSDDVVINAINSVIVFWFFLAFSSIAVGNSELPGPEDIYQKIISAFLIISISLTASRVVLGLLDIWSQQINLYLNRYFKGFDKCAFFQLAFCLFYSPLVFQLHP